MYLQKGYHQFENRNRNQKMLLLTIDFGDDEKRVHHSRRCSMNKIKTRTDFKVDEFLLEYFGSTPETKELETNN